jgi:hypothetical protein
MTEFELLSKRVMLNEVLLNHIFDFVMFNNPSSADTLNDLARTYDEKINNLIAEYNDTKDAPPQRKDADTE